MKSFFDLIIKQIFLLSKYSNVLTIKKFFFQHPVYCMRVVGTQNAHNLISVSTDGKMCSWSLDMLSQPQVCFNNF